MRIEVLPSEEFTSWDGLVSLSPHGTIFHYSWWLEATGCDFEILVCRDEQNELLAGIPLPRRKRAGLILYHSPDLLTPYLGPIFDLSQAAGDYEKHSLMRRLGEDLARAISGYDSFSYVLGAGAPDLQGFLWAGFRVELAYTLRIEAGVSTDQVSEGMARKHKNEIARAQRHALAVETGDDTSALLELCQQTFARQGMTVPYEDSLVRRLVNAALSRGYGRIYLARTSQGTYTASLLVVHDPRSSYQLLAGSHPELRTLGGGNLIEWQAIQDSIQAGRAYDFEGSALRGVEQHCRRWGAVPKPVWRLERAGTLAGALARTLRNWKNYGQRL